MSARRVVPVLPALLVLLTSACGHSGNAAETSPRPSPSGTATQAPPTTVSAAAREVRLYIRDIAIAEETYFTDSLKYLPFEGKGPLELGLAPAPQGTSFGVAVAPHDRYCVVGTSKAVDGFAIWDSAHLGLVTTQAGLKRLPPSCVALARAMVKARG